VAFVEGLREAGGEGWGGGFRHRQDEECCVGEEAGAVDGAACGEGGGGVGAPEQGEVVDAGGEAALGAVEGGLRQGRGGDVADGAGAGAEPEAAHAHRVDGEDAQREGEARPGVHQARVSLTARATRSDAPASSSGSRRRRWPRDMARRGGGGRG
jgi:hypothetical protein